MESDVHRRDAETPSFKSKEKTTAILTSIWDKNR
jgi:hypothetical protein